MFGDDNGANNEANIVETPGSSVLADNMTIAGYMLPDSITSKYWLNNEGSSRLSSHASFIDAAGSSISIRVQLGNGSVVNLNTEDAISAQNIAFGYFEGMIVQQNKVVIAGIADMDKSNFILITFNGVDFKSATSIVNEFLAIN